MFVPVLHTNNVFTGATDVEGDLVRSRISLLTAFMNELFNIPFLLGDAIIQNFLTLDDKEFKSFQDTMNKSTLHELTSSPGAVAWKALLDSFAGNSTPTSAALTKTLAHTHADTYFEELKKYLETLRQSFLTLNEQSAACCKTSQGLYSEMTNTTTAFGAWADAECSTAELPAECTATIRPQNIKRVSDAVVVCMGHWSVTTHSYIKIHAHISTVIQDQLVQVLCVFFFSFLLQH